MHSMEAKNAKQKAPQFGGAFSKDLAIISQ
jgi:hypothetical protein